MSDNTMRKRRLSLTKTQLASGPGAELLGFLQRITDDGSLSNEEIDSLKAWLDAHQATDLPSIACLAEAVERILVDGIVTDAEREYLFDVIEVVLPPDARKAAVAKRRATEPASSTPRKCQTEGCNNLLPGNAAPQRKWCDDCREVRGAPTVSRAGDIPSLDIGFKVAGVSFEGRQEIIREYLCDGDSLVLVRDPANPYDANAVEVRLKTGVQIGFVPREWRERRHEDELRTNLEIAGRLDARLGYTASCWKVLTGGQYLGVYALAKFDGYTVPHPTRVQLAHEWPDSVLAQMLTQGVPERGSPPPTSLRSESEHLPPPNSSIAKFAIERKRSSVRLAVFLALLGLAALLIALTVSR